MHSRSKIKLSVLLAALAFGQAVDSQAEVLWTVGLDDNGWPQGGTLGGEEAVFVQENGAVNALPGDPFSPPEDRQADNDYYFTGEYDDIIPGNGDYVPVGFIDWDEEAAERAFTPGDTEMRYHFNLPSDLDPDSLLSVTFDALSLEGGVADPRYGVEVYFNGVKVQDEIIIRNAQLDTDYTTPQFTLESVNAEVGPGYDNIVTLRGTDYSSDGGGRWMGIDYVQLNAEAEAIPPAVFPWAVGMDDDEWPVGDGGGANATFVQEAGVNDLPGDPNSPEADQQADDDYYFAGAYNEIIAGNGDYQPVGIVSANEEAAERAFAGADNDLRYHFNLPNNLLPTDRLAVTFDAYNFDTSGADPRYGVEVYMNGVLVQEEVIVREAQINSPITTPPFTLGSVNAAVGPGYDNIITLKGISYSEDGGGAWMGIDYVQLNPVLDPVPDPVLPWSVGKNDNAQPAGNGGGSRASFVQENGSINELPGNPASPEIDREADNDYYFAGIYNTVIEGNGDYEPVGDVREHEEAAERAFAGADNDLRYHFNLPADLKDSDQLAILFDALSLQGDAPDPRYGIEVYFNNVQVQSEILIGPNELNQTYVTAPFTVADVNGKMGHGFDNIISLRGVNYNEDGGGNWMGIDYVQLAQVKPAGFPLSVGMDDNGAPEGDGGGARASFVQEAGTNELPGNPYSPEANQLADDDYYFAGEYTQIIDNNDIYDPVGPIFVNEEAAERAFAGSDNTLRYHFNLPDTLSSSDQLMVTFDAYSLDDTGGDPHYGIEIYFNNELIQDELIIYPEDLDRNFTTEPFTLESVHAEVGPGYDNIVTLQGYNYSGEGGGGWMGIDFVNIDPIPTPVFPLAIGMNDDGWPAGDGGGANASFVQEAGINDLPGNPSSPEVNQQADDDYYFAGIYNKGTNGNNFYDPVGIVPRNEEAAERAFAGDDNDLRYHFNLPDSLNLSDEITISFDAFNLHVADDVEDPRYGIEIYFNDVLVQPEIVITQDTLGQKFTTEPFSLSSVKAELGLGPDNIVNLHGINYSADGGGNWMGIDYVHIGEIEEEDTTPPVFAPVSIADGQLTITWTGNGVLEWATSITGPWTAITPAPGSPYTEDVSVASQRFYRLTQP